MLHAREESPCQLGAVHTWPEASVRCVAVIRPEPGVKPTYRHRSTEAIDPSGSRASEWLVNNKPQNRSHM
jgi:hypothetical protein